MRVPTNHPRYWSLTIRDQLVKASDEGIVLPQGLISHGRGEAFDYILGEKTVGPAARATSAAAAFLLEADRPVISVNGNTVALVGREIVRLASTIPAKIEVNLFNRTLHRELRVARHLRRVGAREILGVGSAASMIFPGISSPRAMVDPEGIGRADVVLVPLEDGDRAEALRRTGKTVIAIDLNPLSRTSRVASVTIVDNIVRAIPALVKRSITLKKLPRHLLEGMTTKFNNQENLADTVKEMVRYLRGWERN